MQPLSKTSEKHIVAVIKVNHEKKKKKREKRTRLESLERLKQQLMHSVTQRGTHSRRRRWWDKNCLEMFRLRNKQGFHTKRTSSTLCTAWSLFPPCIISCLGSRYCAGFQPGSVNKVQLSTPADHPPTTTTSRPQSLLQLLHLQFIQHL